MASKVTACCDPSSPSVIWEGSPAGKFINIDSNIETYVTSPRASTTSNQPDGSSEPKRIILFLTEGHGPHLPNAQLLADSFAKQLDCTILMPDQFAGQPRQPLPRGYIPPRSSDTTIPWTEDKSDPNYGNRGLRVPSSDSSDAFLFVKPPWWNERGEGHLYFEEWLKRHEPDVSDPILKRVVKYICTTYGPEVKIGGVGYCFGGRYIMRLMGEGVIDVGVVNHPSFFTMNEVAAVGPEKRLAVFAAEIDGILPTEKRRAMEDILMRERTTWQSTVYGGTRHGFSVRGDLTVKEVRMAKEAAFKGAVEWFKEWL